jgi:hypothetical protein
MEKGNGGSNKGIRLHYSNYGERINDIFKPKVSDAYAFILSNRTLSIVDQLPKRLKLPLFIPGNRK